MRVRLARSRERYREGKAATAAARPVYVVLSISVNSLFQNMYMFWIADYSASLEDTAEPA